MTINNPQPNRKQVSTTKPLSKHTKTSAMAPSSATTTIKTFDDLHGELCKEDVYVRLIHSWEARNFKNGNILMGVEVLLLDSKAVTMQGFISANRLYRFQATLKAGTIYKLPNFVIGPAKRDDNC